jgi:hypothetical protein
MCVSGVPDACTSGRAKEAQIVMNSEIHTQNALTIHDGFDLGDPSASPIRGQNRRFKDGDYYSFAEKLDLSHNTYLVIDLREGWQKLERDCPPEYLIRIPGEPKPPRHTSMKQTG